MKKPVAVFAVLLLAVLAVFCAAQFRTIVVLRAELASAQAEVQAKEAFAHQVPVLKEQNEAFRKESESLRQLLANRKPTDGKGTSAAVIEAAAPGATPAPAKGADSPLAKMMSDPSMKKMIAAQQSAAMRMVYGELTKQLHLDPAKTQELMDLLSQRQSDMMDATMKLGGSGAEAKAAGDEIGDQQKKFDEQLKTLLGDQYGEFGAYEKSIPDRMMMQQYQQMFSTTENPLTEEQRNGLLQIMTEERTKLPASPFDAGNTNVANKLEAMNSDEAVHQFFANQAELNQRVLARASSVLSPEQITAFKGIQKQMQDLQQAGMQMGRAMFKK